MAATYYSPTGNPEIWREGTPPAGYLSAGEWAALHPPPPPPEPTPEELIAQYDAALENKLTAEKVARGYTVREPSEYLDSKVVRYRQDAQDWTNHRDLVMLSGLAMLNEYQQTGQIPSMEDFLGALPSIVWTIDPNNEHPEEGMYIPTE